MARLGLDQPNLEKNQQGYYLDVFIRLRRIRAAERHAGLCPLIISWAEWKACWLLRRQTADEPRPRLRRYQRQHPRAFAILAALWHVRKQGKASIFPWQKLTQLRSAGRAVMDYNMNGRVPGLQETAIRYCAARELSCQGKDKWVALPWRPKKNGRIYARHWARRNG